MSRTEITIDGITFDPNRIPRERYRHFLAQIAEGGEKSDRASGELYQEIVVSWPYGEVSVDTYLKMGMMDAKDVDDAFLQIGEYVNKKKSERLSTSPVDTDAP